VFVAHPVSFTQRIHGIATSFPHSSVIPAFQRHFDWSVIPTTASFPRKSQRHSRKKRWICMAGFPGDRLIRRFTGVVQRYPFGFGLPVQPESNPGSTSFHGGS
jgi:hypothetical protein